ncbi:MAG: Na/Pi cotransporter family protein [Deltaproteobacteria bacterium]|nr:Na/Pi cotransporter family protein [Deltaproteobacteria bacterium]
MDTAWLVLIGGLAIFLHGLDQAKSGLQLAAGDRLRRLIGAITSNRIVGAGAGLLFTVVIQSSTAVTLMVVDYCASGMCDFAEALAVLLGAGLGTTFIVQLVTFNISAYALLLVGAGVAGQLGSRAFAATGRILVGLGLLFFGLDVMGSGVVPLLRGAEGQAAVAFLASRPILSVAAAAAVTVLLQGSAPTIGLVLSAAAAGSLSLEGAIPFVLGANIGTTLTPLLHALRKPIDGRRAAVANITLKIVGAVVVLPLLGPAAHAVALTSASGARQVANAHTLYNAVIMVLGLISLGPIARLVERFYAPELGEQAFRVRHLAPEALDTPALAFGQAVRELMNMAEIVADMLRGIAEPLLENQRDKCDVIVAEDDKVDLLNREIRFYLARLGSDRMSPQQGNRRMQLINVCSDLEGVGDVITRSLIPLARKKADQGVNFSEEGRKELEALLDQVGEAFDTAVSAFATSDEELGRRAQRLVDHITQEEERLRRNHIERLQRSEPGTRGSSSIHLDVLSDLADIAGMLHSLIVAAERPQMSEAEAG